MVQPDHASFVVIELGAVVIVGCDVPVDDGVRVIGIRLVEMLRRQGVEDRQARRERENQDCSPERADHLAIMDEKAERQPRIAALFASNLYGLTAPLYRWT
jgi:hypothetical protein